MKSVGDTLKRARERQGLSVAQVAEQSSIALSYIDAIEQDQFTLLPSYVAAVGFVSSYATVIGLDANAVLALLRRDLDESAFAVPSRKAVFFPSLHPRWKRRFFLAAR